MAKLQRPVLTRFAYYLFRAWSSTWRIKVIFGKNTKKIVGDDNPVAMAHWHGDEIALLTQVGRFKLSTMTSTSKDGELIDFAIKRLGGETARGSSSRGGIGALKKLIRLAKKGYSSSLAVDGPRGPLHEVKPGILEIAKLTKLPLVPVGIFVGSGFVFKKSWNKAVLPWPFSKIVIYFGDPVALSGDTQEDCASLKKSIHSASAMAASATKV